MKEIVISVYDSSYGWSFLINENGTQRIIHRGQYDDWEEYGELDENTNEFERRIAKIVSNHCYSETMNELIKELNKNGYDVIFDEDGYIEFYKGERK